MATKTTKKTSTKKVTEPVKDKEVETSVVEKPVNDENEKLKAQIAEMQAQMKLMAEMMANAKKVEPEAKTENRMIRFVNLKNGTIVLKGSSFWDIEGRFNYRDFPEKEARLIVLNMANYLRKGSVYIDNPEFIKDNDLEYVYATLMSDKELKGLLDTDANNVIQTYRNVNDNQKEIIIDMIVDEKKAGKKINNDVLVELSGLSGKNLLTSEDE